MQGLFGDYPGTEKNYPILRFGRVSLLIEENMPQFSERLGEPVSTDVTKDPYRHNRYFKEFQNGAIYWTPNTCVIRWTKLFIIN